MVVAATREIEAGEELLLSYGERNSDDFFLHCERTLAGGKGGV